MPRVTSVAKAQKAQGECGKCGDKIKVGSPYLWWKFRYGGRRVRCTKPKCHPRQSDLTSSDKLSSLYAAIEGAEDDLADWDSDDIEDLKNARDTAAEEIRRVGEEYGESADNIEQAFPNGSPTAEECREKSDNLESFASDLDSLDFESLDDFKSKKENAEATEDEWREEQRQVLQDALNETPL